MDNDPEAERAADREGLVNRQRCTEVVLELEDLQTTLIRSLMPVADGW